MAPKKDLSMRKKLGLKFHKHAFGKRTNAPSELLTSHFPEQEEKHCERYYYSLEAVSAHGIFPPLLVKNQNYHTVQTTVA